MTDGGKVFVPQMRKGSFSQCTKMYKFMRKSQGQLQNAFWA